MKLDYEHFAKLLDDDAGINERDRNYLSVNPLDGVVLVNGADLTPEPVRWLWEYWLALGKLHILAGAPGQGKTTIAIACMATATIGGRWPDGSRCEAGNVLMWSGEDDPADTLLPRLMAAGADRSKCYFVQGTRLDGELQPFDPARDMVALEQQARAIGGIKLLVVDPVVSAVAGDSHKNTEVRRALQPLVDLASRLAFTAVARVVLVAAKVKSEDGTDRRILARGKSNIGPDDGGFEYLIDQVEALPGIQASRIAWGKAVEGSARELLTDPAENDASESSNTNDAVEILRAELTDACWTPSTAAMQPLKDAGFTKKQIWNASKALGVIRKKGGVKDGWFWRLQPSSQDSKIEDSFEDSEGSNILNGESWEPSGVLESSQPTELQEVI